MNVFQIEEQDQTQFAELPEIAMDLNFGRVNSQYYLVRSCRLAILLDENTFTEPQGTLFAATDPNQSPQDQANYFQNWADNLPILTEIKTATPANAWSSFWGAIGPVSPINPLPPAPPNPPVIFGHLPFKATTLANSVIYRWEAYPTSRRINRSTNPPQIAKDTYAAPASELPFALTGFAAVARFALPSLLPACYRYELQPNAGTAIECGASVPLYGQSGGGVEVKFTGLTKTRCAIADPIVLPAL